MKGFVAFVILILIAISGYNTWQVHELQQEIAQLNVKVKEQQSGGVTDEVVAQATRAIAAAREAIANTDMNSARTALDNARQKVAQAGRTASERAAPTVKWLEDQASELGRQVQDKFHGKQ